MKFIFYILIMHGVDKALASEEGNIDIVEALLSDSRVDPSANRNEAIVNAASNLHMGVLKLLLADFRIC